MEQAVCILENEMLLLVFYKMEWSFCVYFDINGLMTKLGIDRTPRE